MWPMAPRTTSRPSIWRPTRRLRASRRERAPGPLPSSLPAERADVSGRAVQPEGALFRDGEDLLRGDAAGEAVLVGSGAQHGGAVEPDRALVAGVGLARHAAVQGVVNVGAGHALAQGDLDR